MDYMITNPSKSLYVRLVGGRPTTCTKQYRQRFEYSKARNIVDSLPKTMRKFHFRVEPIPEISSSTEKCATNVPEAELAERYPYIVPEEVQEWLDRARQCNGLAKDAAVRKTNLVQKLSNADKELSNCLHEIELSKRKNACNGYKEYRRLKIILERRRVIKDELSVVDSILTSDLQSIATDRIEKVVKNLGKRKFKFRDTDFDDVYASAEGERYGNYENDRSVL